MPRPVYIIVSEAGSEDRVTNLVSLYEVVERIAFEKIPLAGPGQPQVVPSMRLRVTAVWMPEPGDNLEDEYEQEVSMYLPANGHEMVLAEAQRFRFEEGKLSRAIIRLQWPPLFAGPGILRFESRIRKVGDTEWLRTDYPILVEEVVSDPSQHADVQAGSAAPVSSA